ncbi:MAG TPA: T9SS type A sorting domain-containing protein, partial [candidate division Zixibacteria bacterium]|nr:T9SS type A sorting domain-containing protein [candidate division Zixibacteria bacterium]
ENFYIWLDTLSDGTCLAEKIKPLCDFILENGWLYLGEWEISPRENQVRVNGIEVYNGDRFLPAPVNESKVAAALLRTPDSSVLALHIINHNWDTASLEMVPQESLDITVPVEGVCDTVFALAPGTDPITLPFSQSGDTVHIVLPHLENYAVVVFHISPGSEVADHEEHCSGQIKVLSSRNGKLLIETSKRAKLYLYDISGRTVFSKNLPAGRTQIGLPDNLSSGIYILRISVNNKTKMGKVLLLN